MDNSVDLLGPYLYPQGFPLLISPVYFLFGPNFLAIKGFILFFFIGALFLIYKLFEGKFNDKTSALLLVAGIAFHPEFITFGDNILSDFPFFFFSMLCLLCIEGSGPGFFHQAGLALLFIFTFSIREAGIFLLPVLFARQLSLFVKEGDFSFISFMKIFKREKWRFLPYLGFALFILVKRYFFADTSANHINELTHTSSDIIKQNIIYYSEIVAGLIPLNISARWLYILFYFPVIVGLYFYFKAYFHYIVYMLLITLLYVIWPAQQGLRFFYPICPLALFFSLKG